MILSWSAGQYRPALFMKASKVWKTSPANEAVSGRADKTSPASRVISNANAKPKARHMPGFFVSESSLPSVF
jgi:hypothetical protein